MELGLLKPELHQAFEARRGLLNAELERLDKTWLKATPPVNAALASLQSPPLAEAQTLGALLRRTEIRWQDLSLLQGAESGSDVPAPALPREVREQAEIQTKYDGYIRRQLIQVGQFKKLEERKLPQALDYQGVYGLSTEARQKLALLQPISIGQASRISGVTPADVSVLLVYLEARRQEGQHALTVPEPEDI
jgi:tRNA uridine 5-carboxymethylaminomethyl modification enzyme